MGLQATLFASKPDEQAKFLVRTWASSTSEALADALGLKWAYGVDDPEEPGNYLDEKVDSSKIKWDVLARIRGCEWYEGVTPDSIHELVNGGWTLVYAPSY